MKAHTPIWTTIAGKKLAVPNMSTLHILNAIKMLDQNINNKDRKIYLDLHKEISKRRAKNDPNKLIKEIL